MSETAHPDDLVTIDAFAFGTVTGASMGMGILPVPVQVRAADLQRAQAALKQNVADSVDLDWDEVDVGEREDQLPLSTRQGMPVMAKVSVVVAALIVASIILAILVLFVLTLMGWH
jgi:hypothetical protein